MVEEPQQTEHRLDQAEREGDQRQQKLQHGAATRERKGASAATLDAGRSVRWG
jgi:hypothetical protein